jgi:hypothetical protein
MARIRNFAGMDESFSEFAQFGGGVAAELGIQN